MAKACLSPHHFSFLCLLPLGLSQPPPHCCPQPGRGYWRKGGASKEEEVVRLESQLSGSQTLPGEGGSSLPSDSDIPTPLPSKRLPVLPIHRPNLGLSHPWKGLIGSSQGLLPRGASPPQENPSREAGKGCLRLPNISECLSSTSCEQGTGLYTHCASSHFFLTTGSGPMSTRSFPLATKVGRRQQSATRPAGSGSVAVLSQEGRDLNSS